MVRIAIVEDEITYIETFQEYLQRYGQESGEKMEITIFRDGDEIAAGYKGDYDIILMDIQMKFMDGMSAAEEIRKVDPEVVIIFITNMQQYAIRGYAVDALDYVLKPVNYFAFSQRIDRAIHRMKRRITPFITIPIKGGVQKLNAAQIYYIESQGHSLNYYTSIGELRSPGTLKEAEEKLEPLHFCRANKGCLINLEHVDGVQNGCAMVNGVALPLSRSRKNVFMDTLTNYVSEVMK